jgi:parallel beta-helix repeat protein
VNTYTFTSDILNSYIDVECDNIVIDGAGFTLQGETLYGIYLENRSNVRITNINFKSFSTAVRVRDSSHIVIANNGIFAWGHGLVLDSSRDNQIANNNITVNSMVGIGIYGVSYNNLIFGNNFIDTRIAISIKSGGNTFYHNNFFNRSSSSITVSNSRLVNYWDDGKGGNFWSDYSGTDSNKDGIGDTPYHIINSNYIDNYPLMAPADNVAPSIKVLSPENKTYDTSNILLNFTVNEAAAQITYSLDGQENITITGNTTLTELTNGDYNLTIYATDEAGNVGISETIYFRVDVPFPTTLVAAASVATVAVVGVGLLVYFRKRKR